MDSLLRLQGTFDTLNNLAHTTRRFLLTRAIQILLGSPLLVWVFQIISFRFGGVLAWSETLPLNTIQQNKVIDMHNDDLDYCRRRAREEAARAIVHVNPKASAAHRQLADAYQHRVSVLAMHHEEANYEGQFILQA